MKTPQHPQPPPPRRPHPSGTRKEGLVALVLRRSALTKSEMALFRAEFGTLYTGHYQLVSNALWKRGVRSPVLEERVHDVYMKFCVWVEKNGFPESVPAKLQGLAMGLALNERRRKSRNPVDLGPPSSTSEKPHSSPDIGRAMDLAKLAQRVLPALSPKHSAVIRLVVMRGLDHDEAAAELKIPRSTLTNRLVAAKKRLVELVDELLPASFRGLA